MLLGSLINYYSITFLVENNQTKSTNEVKLLEITIDHKLNFTKRINNLCNTSSKSLRAMERIEKFFIPRASKTSF